jgi:hypothetical protein
MCWSAEKKNRLRKGKVRLRAPGIYLGMNVLQLYDTTADGLSGRYSNHVRPTELHYTHINWRLLCSRETGTEMTSKLGAKERG